MPYVYLASGGGQYVNVTFYAYRSCTFFCFDSWGHYAIVGTQGSTCSEGAEISVTGWTITIDFKALVSQAYIISYGPILGVAITNAR